MRILITGGCGFKGAVLCNRLQRRPEITEIAVVDSHFWGVRHVPAMIDAGVTVITGDIRDESLMKTLIPRFDCVINLAAIVGYPACAKIPEIATQVNVEAVINMLDLMSSNQLFIQASTGSVYGKLEEICTEESPKNPLSVYGKTKLAAEKFVLDFGGICPRFATAFGVSPCMRFDLLPNFLSYRAVHDGFLVLYEAQARRTLIDVHDMADAYLFMIDNYDKMRGEIYNVGDESFNVTKVKIAKIVAGLTKAQIIIESVGEDKDGRDYEVDYTKIKNLGFSCKRSLYDELCRIVECARLVERSGEWRMT